MPETHNLRPQIDIGSNILLLLGDVHAAACGIEIEGLRPFDASQGFFRQSGMRLCASGRSLFSRSELILIAYSCFAFVGLDTPLYSRIFPSAPQLPGV